MIGVGISTAFAASYGGGGGPPTVSIALTIPADAVPGAAVTLPALPDGLLYVLGAYENALGSTLTITSQSAATVDLNGAFNALPEGSTATAYWLVSTTEAEPVGSFLLLEDGTSLLLEDGTEILLEAA